MILSRAQLLYELLNANQLLAVKTSRIKQPYRVLLPISLSQVMKNEGRGEMSIYRAAYSLGGKCLRAEAM